ncbi:FAD-dependent oxidoreductase [Luteimonas sp. 50]|uniref:FAD-dependent oxidoreductase n=1 Tax=Cognatiluteimonas sedimenti TaxID=2927791 RepID=A0ABT0A152_9GAMM|nr:FAD-dependent oxidoreductase [Lysobacter sedimenti]MCJ0824715.1 FAD-dependent oxidoreductase [Lysobacter sedimenti]
MRIAVVGSGIGGLSAAWLLSRRHDVVLYEASDYLGGHTDTHAVAVDGRVVRVDTGFIVHNPVHYPLLSRMFDELGVASKATTMSFSVQDACSRLEYNATSLDTLFCQRRNLVSPRFWGMLRDLRRFYRAAPGLLDHAGGGPSLGDYLDENGYGAAFRDLHLVPMASALWSSPAAAIMRFPAKYLVRFMANHHMLQLTGRPAWRVVEGGSRSYVEAMASDWRVQVRLRRPVRGIARDAHGVRVRCDHGVERYDQVVLACHADEALALLDDPGQGEREILGAFAFQANDTVLHTDAALLPRNRKAWAAWNAHVPADPAQGCTVSYCMNLLQGLEAAKPLVVTLNRTDDIDPATMLVRRSYRHPVYTHAMVAAQARKHEIQGMDRTWFAGAYWGWGFHEDGMRSGVEVAGALGVAWPGAAAVASARCERSLSVAA